MTIKKDIIISAILMLTSALSAQVTETDISGLFLPQGNVSESVSGTGFPNSTGNHITDIGSGNPASLNHFESLSSGVSWQLDSSIQPAWIQQTGHKRDKTFLPQSFGLAVPFETLRIGVGISQRYNSVLDLGKYEITTIEHPEGTGEYCSFSRSELVVSYCGMLSYSFKNAIQNHDRLSLGIRCHYNRLDFEDKLCHSSARAHSGTIGFSGGVHYIISDRYQFGAFYERNPSFRGEIDAGGQDLTTQLDSDPSIGGNNININPQFTTKFYVKGKLPDKLHVGLSCQCISSVKISYDLIYVFWDQLSQYSKNNLDMSGSIVVDIIKNLSLSSSFLSTDRRYEKNSNINFLTDGKLYSFFLAGGLTFKLQHFDVDLAYVTSTSFSQEWRKQQQARASVGFYL